MHSTLAYETGGKDMRTPADIVVSVRRVVMLSEIRAGTAEGSIQKEVHEMQTIRKVGMYVWTMW